ncbi:sensor histidine kinase [Paractinoplanes brasiliensis]|uniref:histidine kinase n=1 Tax=Paractinoplanes brasiliensis TaxID=52695 RepID=A0A4R6J6X5_9ACTN|nr:histidine kinase [Actinoplanes brasiliensis]TDO31244.1 histidine kinase [Actinoplanes brasiliensis]GID28437.1 two-component sensor histidine kinase [Actinoplanes brasiliensis]
MFRATTYRRGVFLLLGAVVLLPYTLVAVLLAQAYQASGENVAGAFSAGAVALVVAAIPPFLGGTRELEITAARALLGADLPAHDRDHPLTREARLRSALWFGLHLLGGGVVALLLMIAVPLALLAFVERLGLTNGALAGTDIGPLRSDNRWGWTAVGVVLLVVSVCMTAGLGSLAATMAPVLLGPSAAERVAALEARERQLAERNRLARELHDSVGHALTAVTLQAGAARTVFDSDPAFARRALGSIEDLGRTALEELDAVLGLLRDDASGPTLADVGRLLTGEVDAEVDDVDVPAPISREAYRIVQECLTNAAKHGSGRVTLRITAPDDLVVEVANAVGEWPRTATRSCPRPPVAGPTWC